MIARCLEYLVAPRMTIHMIPERRCVCVCVCVYVYIYMCRCEERPRLSCETRPALAFGTFMPSRHHGSAFRKKAFLPCWAPTGLAKPRSSTC